MGGVYAHLRNDLIALVGILGLILRTSLIVLVLVKGKGIIGLALVALVIEAAMYLAYYLILRQIQKGLHISFALASKNVFKELLHYGGYSVVIRVGNRFRFAVDAWMVAAFVGLSAVAHYTIASRLSGYFLTFIASAVGLLQSWFSQLLGSQDYVGIRRILTFGTRVATVLSTIVMVSFVLYGRAFSRRMDGIVLRRRVLACGHPYRSALLRSGPTTVSRISYGGFATPLFGVSDAW